MQMFVLDVFLFVSLLLHKEAKFEWEKYPYAYNRYCLIFTNERLNNFVLDGKISTSNDLLSWSWSCSTLTYYYSIIIVFGGRGTNFELPDIGGITLLFARIHLVHRETSTCQNLIPHLVLSASGLLGISNHIDLENCSYDVA